jgi:hypothetical protein
MWAEVVEVARVEGVEATAHALRLAPARLAARMTAAGTAAGERGMPAEMGGGRVHRAGRRPPLAVAATCPIARPHPAEATFRQAGAILPATFRTSRAPQLDRGGGRCRVDSRPPSVGYSLVTTHGSGQLLTMRACDTVTQSSRHPLAGMATCLLSTKRSAIASVAPFGSDATTATRPLKRHIPAFSPAHHAHRLPPRHRRQAEIPIA